jgi:hypothetical protein
MLRETWIAMQSVISVLERNLFVVVFVTTTAEKGRKIVVVSGVEMLYIWSLYLCSITECIWSTCHERCPDEFQETSASKHMQ